MVLVRRALAVAVVLGILALAGRARDVPATGAGPSMGRREAIAATRTVRSGRAPAREALPARPSSGAHSPAATEARASTGPRRRLPALRAHLLDPCVAPVDPDPPVPEGFDRLDVGARVHVAWARGAMDASRAIELASHVEEGIELAAAVTDGIPRETVTVVVYESVAALREALDLPEWVHGVYDGAVRTGADGRHLRQVLRHEATHAQLHDAVGCVPTWLNEGLAKYVQGHAADVVEPWIRQIDRREAIPFDDLAGPTLLDIPDDEQVTVHYAQSLAMVLWLEKRIGIPDAVDRLLAERVDPDRLWSALMPEETPADYIGFLVDHLRLPAAGGCALRVDDVDALRCLTPEEERAAY